MRDGQRIPIDFQALIQEGDLRYNIHVHPGDFIYFPSTLASEIYVLGNVRSPGAQAYAGSMTLGSALARRWLKRRSLCKRHPRHPWQPATSHRLPH